MIFFVENGKYPNFGIEHFSFPYLFSEYGNGIIHHVPIPQS